MKPSLHGSKVLPAVVMVAAFLGIFGICGTSLASPYENKDFSLRFPAALSRFATYGDAAGVGGASAGSKWSSSINPASISWLDVEGPLQMCVSGQYNRLYFDHGTTFDVFAESFTWDADDLGTFLIGVAQVKTNRRRTDNLGMDFYFAGDILQLQWAKKLTEDWAVGINLGWTKSICRYDLGPIPILKSNSDCYNIRVGTLHKLTEKWKGGLVLDYGWSRDRTNYYAIPLMQSPETHVYDNTRQFLVRPGVTYEYMKDCMVYVDYQFGTFWNNTGTMNVHRVYAGVEHGLNEWIFARAGTCIDPCVKTSAWTCGLGFYPAKWLSFDVAYQYDMFPELIEEFGHSHTLNVSASITF